MIQRAPTDLAGHVTDRLHTCGYYTFEYTLTRKSLECVVLRQATNSVPLSDLRKALAPVFAVTLIPDRIDSRLEVRSMP